MIAALLLILAPCVGVERPTVVVEATRGTLDLCRGGRSEGSFSVAFGVGGVGKRRRGDGKTPLGRYRLGTPRASVGGFHRFIPVGYPTAAQRRQGYTGSAIGIHGPHRATRWLGRAANLVDWTNGCVAVAEDAEIDAIEAWVRRRKAGWIVLRETPRQGSRAGARSDG